MPVWVLTDHCGTGNAVPFLMLAYTTHQLLIKCEQSMKCWADVDSSRIKSHEKCAE